MGYEKALETLKKHEQKSLVRCHYEYGGEFCALGVLVPSLRSREFRGIDIGKVVRSNKQIADALASTGMTTDEAVNLQVCNDTFGSSSPADGHARYLFIMRWLREKL